MDAALDKGDIRMPLRSSTGSGHSLRLCPRLDSELYVVPARLNQLLVALLSFFHQQERLRNKLSRNIEMPTRVSRELFGPEMAVFPAWISEPQVLLPRESQGHSARGTKPVREMLICIALEKDKRECTTGQPI